MAHDATPVPVGTVAECWRYPVKSLQGAPVDALEVDRTGIGGDRAFGIVDVSTGRLLSAKRTPVLLQATGHDRSLALPDGSTVSVEDPDADARLSQWLGRDVRLVASAGAGPLSYEMTFDPPNEEAEVYDIPVPEGTLLDLTPVHAIASATLAACAAARPDLDWDVRRFRPNLVLDMDLEPFGEQSWVGQQVSIGATVLSVTMPMLRCAMPLRAQAGGVGKEPGIFEALSELNGAFPNHLGICLDVVEPGRIEPGDEVALSA